jgi:GntR family transcriptional regulator, rspAB operon transcriptional repressor
MDDLTTSASERTNAYGRGAATYVFQSLRQDIIALTLAPGTVLSRADLQDRFGLSSTPIRDALIRLQEEGLVAVFPQHATVVSPIDLDKARQGQFLRLSVELEIVRALAMKPDQASIERLRSLIRQQSAFARLGEHAAFTSADQTFHRTMYDFAGASDLWNVVSRHGGHIDRLRRLHLPVPGKMRDVVRDHKSIVGAIGEGKPEEAQLRLREHLSQSLSFVENLKVSHPEYFRVK